MTVETIKVLSIEDNSGDARLIQVMLDEAQSLAWDLPRFELEWVRTLTNGLARLDQGGIDVVLSDLDLPDSRAGDTFTAIHAHAPQMPIVVLTGRDDPELARQTVRAGAEDYLFKREMSGPLLAHALIYAIERQQAKQALQKAHDQLERRVEERTAELERANKRLRESERRYRELFENSRDGFVFVDIQGRFIDANQAYCQMLGYTLDELRQKADFYEITPPRWREWERKEIWEKRLLQDGYSGKYEKEYIRKDGTVFPVELESYTVLDEEGEPQYLWGVARDITEQRQAKEALRQSSEERRVLLDLVPVGITITDETGNIIDANRMSEELLGVPVEEHVRRRYDGPEWQIVRPDGTPMPAEEYASVRALQEQRPVRNVEMGVVRPDDRIAWVSVSAAPIPLEDYGVAITYADVTERVRAEEALRESIAALNASQAMAQLGSWELDLIANRLTWSDEVYRIFGLRPQEFDATYEAFLNAVHPDDRAAVDAAYSGSLREGQDSYEIEHRVIRRDSGEVRTVHEKCRHVRDNSGQVVRSVGMVQDITERARAEEEIKRYAAELERSNQELEQFAHIVSHDLREPLRMVKSYLELVQGRCLDQLDPETGAFIGYAVDGAARMQRMIRALLDLTRVHIRGRELAPVDCQPLLERTLAMYKIAIKESGAQVSHNPLPTVLADEDQLAQVFQNLIGNALKFHGEESPRIHVSARREGNEWLFSVRDNGIGIDPAQAKRVFELFRRLHTQDEYEGTGIGLALCQKIVERHGGRIWVESQPGQGSTFYFTLPAVVA